MDQKLPPMQISILDENFVKVAGAVEYQSLMWHRCYYRPGDFLLQVKASDYDPSWAYVYCDDRPETGIIQKVEYDDSYTGPTGDDTVLLSGFFLEYILSRLVFLVEESEEQKVVVPKPTRPSYTQPTFFTDKNGDYYVRHTTYSDLGRERKDAYVNCMTGDMVLTDDLPELTEADVTPGDGLTEQTYTNPSGERYTTGIYSTLYGYVTDGTDKLTVLLANNTEKKSYDIIGDPSSGLVLYEDDDGNVRWVNGVVESKADTYYRKVQSWEHLDVDEDGNRYYTKTVMGPWMLRTDLDDVTTPQDNVQWVLKMAQKIFGSNFIYDKPTFTGETKTLSPSLTYVGDYFYSELQSVEASLRVFYHYESDAMVFQLWQGIDRTQDQGEQTIVVPDPILPTGYTQLDYIESSGTQYIDLGVMPSSDTEVELDAYVLDTNTGTNHQICSSSDGSSYFFLRLSGDRSGYGFRLGSSSLSNVKISDVFARHVFTIGNNSLSIDGAVSTVSSGEFAVSQPLALFCSNSSGNYANKTKMRLYRIHLKDDDNYVIDGYPARRDSDGEIGLYDMVSGSFFTNAGTGLFVAGPDAEVPSHTETVQGNPWAVFSDTWGTLTGFSASHDTSNYRNKCYVLYEYDEPVWDDDGTVKITVTAEFDENGAVTGRKYVTATETKRGYLIVRLEDDREDMEVWLDERGEQPNFMDDAEFGEFDSEPSYSFTKADFDAWVESLKAEGETLLKTDYGDVDQLDTGTLSAGDYLTGWNLGDKVDMEASVVGMVKTARITEVEETYESGKSDVKITIGDEKLTATKRARLT